MKWMSCSLLLLFKNEFAFVLSESPYFWETFIFTFLTKLHSRANSRESVFMAPVARLAAKSSTTLPHSGSSS